MAEFEVAHIRRQGVDLIIVPLDSSFGRKPQVEQTQITNQLQSCATSAGLSGTVVPVWESGRGGLSFLAPKPWHPFFKSLDWLTISANINRKLTCSSA